MKHNQIGTPRVFTERQQALLDHYGTRAESTFVELRDPALQAHVLHAGRGEPVVMVHGGNSVAVGMQPLFGQLAERFSVYAADRPGYGLTDSYVYRRTDVRRHGVAFIGSLLDQLGLETVALVGNSMGGFRRDLHDRSDHRWTRHGGHRRWPAPFRDRLSARAVAGEDVARPPVR